MRRLAAIFSAVAACTADAASFDCAKAQSRIEKLICAEREVSDLDEYLGRYYFGARSAVREAAPCLAADQKQWLSSVRNKCADAACLRKVYLERLAELHRLQPGVTALRNVELPRVAQLEWIIAPARDTVAAPPRPKAQPLVATGRIVDEVTDGDGFVLRTADGKSHILVLLMFIDDTIGHLPALAKEPNATFMARGHAAVSPQGHVYYEPSRCVFLYRLP